MGLLQPLGDSDLTIGSSILSFSFLGSTCLAACLDKAEETRQEKLALIYYWGAAIGKPRVVTGVGHGN